MVPVVVPVVVKRVVAWWWVVMGPLVGSGGVGWDGGRVLTRPCGGGVVVGDGGVVIDGGWMVVDHGRPLSVVVIAVYVV